MRDHREHRDHRLERLSGPSVRSWKGADQPGSEQMASNVALDCGWGRLIFGQTFETPQALAKSLLQESPGRRDIGFYIRDPHVVLSLAPDRLFLDPSHAYRLWLDRYRPAKRPKAGFVIRRAASSTDFEELQRIYALRHMVHPSLEFLRENRRSRTLTYFLAEDKSEHGILGSIMGVDHVHAINDPENGSSFWCLAVDPLCARPGVGEGLVRFVIEHYMARGRSFVDLSVMHDNEEAIALYDKMGFERAPVFTVKRKNPINEPLFIAPDVAPDLNPYARLIVDEARRRGITVEILDEP
ncbi:MAG: GNAT family N-acetyltransferase, partial [Desulfovibrionaceae bacterium]